MKKFYNIKGGKILSTDNINSTIRIYSFPDEDEKQEIVDELGIDRNDIDAALDPDEISRVEFTQKQTSIIWKKPFKGSIEHGSQFDVVSVGFFIRNGILIMITGEDFVPFSEKIFERVNSISDVILRYFFYTSRQFLSNLKAIKQVTSKLESKISFSMENKYFLQMFEISESLVYYIDAIEANGAVLAKLRTNTDKLDFSQRQINYLQDIIQENTQSARQANIYSTVLSGLMDARGNIINNNMNVLLKNLTLINVIFLPLNLIAGMGGMSEFTMILGEYKIDWQLGYVFFSIAMVVLGWLTWITLKRYLGFPGSGNVGNK